jgi:selenide,water dikinase
MGVLCDPQTSGGLLLALPPEQGPAYEAKFEELLGRKPARIGEVTDGPTGTIFIR